jgi:hypothetical protein
MRWQWRDSRKFIVNVLIAIVTQSRRGELHALDMLSAALI